MVTGDPDRGNGKAWHRRAQSGKNRHSHSFCGSLGLTAIFSRAQMGTFILSGCVHRGTTAVPRTGSRGSIKGYIIIGSNLELTSALNPAPLKARLRHKFYWRLKQSHLYRGVAFCRGTVSETPPAPCLFHYGAVCQPLAQKTEQFQLKLPSLARPL